MNKSIVPIWDKNAIDDLKQIYTFNKKHFSKEFAQKLRDEIYQKAGDIIFLEQWQEDEILKTPYRRIIVRHFKIVYLVKDSNLIYILMVFDTRQDPKKFKIRK